jgi:hypothetical protein
MALMAAIAVLYAWFATGLAPFSDAAYVALIVPAATALLVYSALGGFSASPGGISSYYRARGASARLLPWTAVFAVALGLEIAGLALGGRSQDVPTLSTTIDHLLVTHWGRWLLYLWWLWIGVRGIVPHARWQQRRETS